MGAGASRRAEPAAPAAAAPHATKRPRADADAADTSPPPPKRTPPAPTAVPAELSYGEAVSSDGDALRAALSEHGYALVRSVVTEPPLLARWADDTRALLARVALGAAAAPGDAAALFADADAVFDNARWASGLCPVLDGYGAGHTAAAWEARLHGRVRGVFAALWRTRQLVTSFDGAAAERPSRATPPQPRLHTDQNPFGPGGGGGGDGESEGGLLCAQGVLSLTATTPHTGGTTLVVRCVRDATRARCVGVKRLHCSAASCSHPACYASHLSHVGRTAITARC